MCNLSPSASTALYVVTFDDYRRREDAKTKIKGAHAKMPTLRISGNAQEEESSKRDDKNEQTSALVKRVDSTSGNCCCIDVEGLRETQLK